MRFDGFLGTPTLSRRARDVARTVATACFGLVWLGSAIALAQPEAQQINDPRFRDVYQRQYRALDGVAADLIVMELRDRVELIVGGGSSHVGVASNRGRVRGFEAALLEGLQRTACRGAPLGPARPASIVVEQVGAAARGQALRLQPADAAQLSAMAQRLLDDQPRDRLCSLKSLDDIR